jgi:hypothetical protein
MGTFTASWNLPGSKVQNVMAFAQNSLGWYTVTIPIPPGVKAGLSTLTLSKTRALTIRGLHVEVSSEYFRAST